MRSLLLIVLYNKQVKDAKTINSLLKSNYQGEIYIFNNGPNSIELNNDTRKSLEGKFVKVHFEQDVNNRPLSVMYNDILSLKGYDEFYLFDDDTEVPVDFFNLAVCDADLILPIIRDTADIESFYPLVNGHVKTTYGDLENGANVLSVGSGLKLSSSLLDKFHKHNMKPFDERFSLYGVDFSLFRRINILNSMGETVSITVRGVLNHSLSRIESKPSKWRETERLSDQILTKIHYSRRAPITTYSHIFYLAVARIIRGDFYSARLILRLAIRKCHPRSEKYKFRW
ncbi:hypothetical protein LLQ54_13655 [Rouxiella badensis]|uniref:hypothetical protein n=1 Tax=Rouxiella badensis TaxID=1646377 RepID=UPI001D13D864|nr:hypothetical protein [Rouxiella badensis]MCC3719626.1 hypothetical protein [Rouxiella badensis]MCC3728876.1 hypothetical protein [Rouxiella badensis]MCC3740928.1 hypothetical protein [Rouxiella badensis]